MSNEDLPIKATRKSSISSVPSREQLLESAAAYFANEMRAMKQRRTKIIATLSDTVNSADDIRNFLLSGMNIIRVTMAYCSQKITSQSLEIIMKNKALIEKEQGCFIPIIMDTKGSTLRIGSFDTPGGEITLKKGQEFRICTNKKIRGNQHIVSCDDSDLGNLVTVGDTLVIDYGRNVLVVKGIEKESDSMAHLKDQFPPRTDTPLLPKRVQLLKKSSFNEGYSCSSNEEDMSETSPKSAEDLGGEEKHQATEEGTENPDAEKQEDKIPRRRFRMAFQKKKKTEKDVIVCEAVSDCRIQSGKALFIQERARANPKTYNKKAFSMPEGHSEDLEESSCIGVKDIKDLNLAVKLDIDAVAITGVQSRKDVDEARFILGQKSHIRVISKIQNAESLENFDEILEASDGIIISRSYLSMHIPVEKLFFKQKEMINKCHAAGKPVTITTQVLDSMVMGLVPTSSEINDIANLILDGVDSFTLVSETLYGLHKREALETLSRICYEIEYNQILSHQRQLTKPEALQIHDIFTPPPPTGDYLIPQIDPSTTPDTIAECVIKAVYDLDASLIVSFTQTGSTILKISKLRAPCPIVAVTVDEKVARQVSLLASVTAVKVGSMYGKEVLTQKVIEIGLEKKWVKKGDFIVICFGEVDFTGATNSLRIIKVQ